MEKNAIILSDVLKIHKYYAVHCRCGHVGINRYVEIVFAVIAKSRKEAAKKARYFARVKHNKKNAIIDCYEITREEYDQIILTNQSDPYLHCSNIQQQRLINGFESRILEEPAKEVFKKSKHERKEFIKYKLRKQKQLIESLNMSMTISL